MPATEFRVKRRSCFYPFLFQVELNKPMKDKKVCSYEFKQLPRYKVISHGGKPHPRRYSQGSSGCTEKRSFGHTKTSAPLQYVARPIMFGKVEWSIWIIANPVTNRKKEPYRPFNRTCCAACYIMRKGLYGLVIAVNYRRWNKVFPHGHSLLRNLYTIRIA